MTQREKCVAVLEKFINPGSILPGMVDETLALIREDPSIQRNRCIWMLLRNIGRSTQWIVDEVMEFVRQEMPTDSQKSIASLRYSFLRHEAQVKSYREKMFEEG